MQRLSAIPKAKWIEVGDLYLAGNSMRQVADTFNVPIDAVTYILRKMNVPRRSRTLGRVLRYESDPASYTLRSSEITELDKMGALLYWAEGYKRESSSGIDFANSDPDMALAFWKFMQGRYVLDQKRLYFSIYHYSDQDIQVLVRFWSEKLGVSSTQFKHHYQKSNPIKQARKLAYGVLHIRYTDKKILRDVRKLIECCKVRYCGQNA